MIGALGVVFGDIGTSPIYTLQTVFNPSDPHPVPVTTENVYGVVSLVFWSVVIIVLVTYVLLAMRADNDGEGGSMALITLLRRWSSQRGRRAAAVLVALGIFGASLFFGDSMITPVRMISLAGAGGDLAATLGASAVNAGIASGAVVGGWAVAAFGLDQVPLAALIICLAALPATSATRWLKAPTDDGCGDTR
ncbi:KUP/HAK/KT family potassium transporter [Streptomyces sp. NBC_01410]|uniref:KUP/HAK/KT family potassium transporter n=1 Tax=Streptomyces sp. NBC_01410 TaxID=2903856 RepID=UPI003243513F